MAALVRSVKGRWFQRSTRRDERRPRVTDGGHSGADRRGAWLRSYAAIGLFVVLIDVTNVFSAISDGARQGRAMPAWHPVLWEASSGIATLAVCWIVGWAMIVARPGRAPWRRIAVIHALSSLAFSIAHVGLMVPLRIAVHALAGEQYRFMAWEWLYEYRKDAVAYLILAAIFWYFTRPVEEPLANPTPSADVDPEITIPQGSGFVRVRTADLLTIKAGGNYVEYGLEDGRTLLVRASMQDTEAALAPLGFVRTHRSWLVNRQAVSAVGPSVVGELEVKLRDGRTIPLARRYRMVALSGLHAG